MKYWFSNYKILNTCNFNLITYMFFEGNLITYMLWSSNGVIERIVWN